MGRRPLGIFISRSEQDGQIYQQQMQYPKSRVRETYNNLSYVYDVQRNNAAKYEVDEGFLLPHAFVLSYYIIDMK